MYNYFIGCQSVFFSDFLLKKKKTFSTSIIVLLEINVLIFQKCRLDWPVRALSFSHDGKMLASGSEDLYVDIADVTTGEKVRNYFYIFIYYWKFLKLLIVFGFNI